tara:strand:- start:174 stop:302 length:129 start_codon:yes stop_codon:yes gene_type:complete
MFGMSFLFDKRTKKAIKWVWVVIATLIILSMIFAFSFGSGGV